jgi:ElaB/YqjD/DUF883 family membrane-anchored ribosome-binding protein
MEDQFNNDTRQNYDSSGSGYDSSTSSGESSATGTATKMKEQAVEKAGQVKEKLSEFSKKAGEQMDVQREKAASGFSSTATALHERGDQIASAASSAAHATADKIQAAADYIRENDFHAMAEDVSGVVRRYPGQALAAAVVVGFLAGRALWNRD